MPKNFSRLCRKQWGRRCVYTGCAANRGAGVAFTQAAPRTEGQALRLYRLCRKQWGRRCVYTGCAANRGAGVAFTQAAPRTEGQALRLYRLCREPWEGRISIKRPRAGDGAAGGFFIDCGTQSIKNLFKVCDFYGFCWCSVVYKPLIIYNGGKTWKLFKSITKTGGMNTYY
ncbi:hypothetical protein FMM72_14770 [Anaerotruncus colihominis]|uniref:Uncharacterized protein n=1 Tax=Anaerotruncus colihominis TaxID=169435 RepID=A0A845T2W7_9FIRM|nr:hypothetical protein [Anaerotruncus colihominis]